MIVDVGIKNFAKCENAFAIPYVSCSLRDDYFTAQEMWQSNGQWPQKKLFWVTHESQGKIASASKCSKETAFYLLPRPLSLCFKKTGFFACQRQLRNRHLRDRDLSDWISGPGNVKRWLTVTSFLRTEKNYGLTIQCNIDVICSSGAVSRCQSDR